MTVSVHKTGDIDQKEIKSNCMTMPVQDLSFFVIL